MRRSEPRRERQDHVEQPGKVRVGIIPLREMATDITRRKIADGTAL